MKRLGTALYSDNCLCLNDAAMSCAMRNVCKETKIAYDHANIKELKFPLHVPHPGSAPVALT